MKTKVVHCVFDSDLIQDDFPRKLNKNQKNKRNITINFLLKL